MRTGRNNRGQAVVEAAVYLPVILIILTVLILLGLSKMDMVLRDDREREQDRELAQAMALDGMTRTYQYDYAGTEIGMQGGLSGEDLTALYQRRIESAGASSGEEPWNGIADKREDYLFISLFSKEAGGTYEKHLNQWGIYRVSHTQNVKRLVRGWIPLATGKESDSLSRTTITAFAANHAELERVMELYRNSDAIEDCLGVDSYTLKRRRESD